MRVTSFLGLCLAILSTACNKSAPQGGASTTSAGVAVNKQAFYDSARLTAEFKAATTPEKRTQAIYHAVELDSNGEDVIPALLEALKDPTAGTLGRSTDRPNSTRETAVQALLMLKEKGKRALLDSGLKTLENGLKSDKPNVREHTANAIGMVGSDANSSADMVAKLCADREKEVRGAAYRALQKMKPFSPAPILRLLRHSNLEVAGEAAAALSWLKPTGPESVQLLLDALQRPRREKEEASDVRFIQNAAAEALSHVGKGADAAVPTLVEVLLKTNKDDVEAMIRPQKAGDNSSNLSGPVLALRRIGKPAVPLVAQLLKHNDALVRYLAAAVLSGMNKGEAAEALPQIEAALEVERGLPTGQMFVFEELAAGLINAGGESEKVTKVVIELLKSDEEAVRYRAAKLLARVGRKAAPAVPRLMDLLNDPVIQVQFAAVEALGAIGPAAKEAVIELGKKVGGDNVDLAREAAKALRGFGPAAAPATPGLAKALDSVDQGLCTDAALALAAIGPEAVGAVEAIAKHLGDEISRREEKVALLQAAAAIGPPAKDAIPAVMKLLSEKDHPVRMAAAETLGKIAAGNADAVKKLTELLKDTKTSPSLQVAAIRALAGMGAGGKSAAGDIKAFLEVTKDRPAKVWAAAALVALGTDGEANAQAVVAALKDMTPQGRVTRVAAIDAAELLGAKAKLAVPDLIEALNEKPVARAEGGQVRERAARTLGRLGANAKDAVRPLSDLTRDPDRNMRKIAVEALGQFGPDAVAAAPKLRELARTDPDLASEIQAALDRIEPAKMME